MISRTTRSSSSEIKNPKYHKRFKELCEEFNDILAEEPPCPGKFLKFDDDKKVDGTMDDGYIGCPTKDLPRVIVKFLYKYKKDATKIVDIIRASFKFDDLITLYEALYMAIEFFQLENGTVQKRDPHRKWMEVTQSPGRRSQARSPGRRRQTRSRRFEEANKSFGAPQGRGIWAPVPRGISSIGM